ncbi:MAG: DUF819 family protein, partial [Balneolaceae bacterium]|nr:DUF819 family protein [Balneolaceae bacterium]
DLLLGGLYLLFLLSAAQRLFGYLLPGFSAPGSDTADRSPGPNRGALAARDAPARMRTYLTPLLLSAGILGVAVSVSYAATGRVSEVVVILSVTTLGVAASFSGTVRSLEGSYPLGEYLLMIFCIAIGSLADIQQLIDASTTYILYVAFVMVSSIGIHLLLAFLFRIDTDTFLITSTAGLYGPAFVPVIAKALHNDKIVVSGLTTGLIGYAVANYLGLAVAYLLQ